MATTKSKATVAATKAATPAKTTQAKTTQAKTTQAKTTQAKTKAAQEPPTATQLQLQAFEKGVRLFSGQRFADAAETLRIVVKGPALHVADRARGYLQVCERRLNTPKIDLRSADDHFNYGVDRLNARDLDKAKMHLASALKIQPKGDHILYALAISCGLAGDGSGAYENLKRAIEVEPRNRMHARHDSDFTAVAERFPELRSLVEA